MKYYLIALQLGLLLTACAKENKFAGGAGSGSTEEAPGAVDEASSGKAPSSATESASFDAASSGPGVDSCTEGDKVVVPWTGAAKECIDQGKTYLFDTKTCADIRKATFSCDWATLQEKLQEKSLLSETLKSEAAAGAKLISCGQSADGNRFAVQWVKLTTSSLSCAKVQQGGGITTGCYTHYENGNVPPPAANDEEKRQRVFACLKQL